MKRTIPILFALIIFAAGEFRTFAQGIVDQIIAVVDVSPITSVEVVNLTRQDKDFIVDRYGAHREVMNRKLMDLQKSATDELINKKVILKAGADTFKIPESIIEEYVNDLIKEDHPDHVALLKQLQVDGMTMEQLKRRYRDRVIVNQMYIKNVPQPIISPRKVENYYLAHRDEFKVEDEVKFRMIFLGKDKDSAMLTESARKRANELLTQLNGGASFEELAKTYSEGSLKEQGGETGWEEVSVVNKSLVEELNKLKANQHSGVIEAEEGFYLLLLEDRHPTHYKPINEVRAKIETTLVATETDTKQKEWVERLKKKTFVSMF